MGDPADSKAPVVRPSLKQRLSGLTAEYGKVAIVTYVALSVLAIVGFSIAIGIGAQPSSASGFVGVIVAGWAAAKVTMPIRILLTLGLTPVVAWVVKRLRPSAPAPDRDATP